MVVFTPQRQDTLVIAGCGGIGARIACVLPRLPVIHSAFTRVWFIDPDTVEARNLARQHFSPADIGRPKAEVLAERYRVQNIDVLACRCRAEEFIRADTRRILVVSAVDSRSARRAIMEAAALREASIIDVACGETWGHVTYSSRATMEVDHISHRVTVVGALATPDIYDPASADDPAPSCGDDTGDGQTTVLNVAAASLAVSLIDVIARRQPLATCAWTFGPMSVTPAKCNLVVDGMYLVPEPITAAQPDAQYSVFGVPVTTLRAA